MRHCCGTRPPFLQPMLFCSALWHSHQARWMFGGLSAKLSRSRRPYAIRISRPESDNFAIGFDSNQPRWAKFRCSMRMRHPSPAARAIRNNSAATVTAPTARATRSPAGARRSTVMAAATTAIARRSTTPMTRRIAIRPAQHWLQWRPRRRPCRQAVPDVGRQRTAAPGCRLPAAKALMRSAARVFGPKEAVARARCVVADTSSAGGSKTIFAKSDAHRRRRDLDARLSVPRRCADRGSPVRDRRPTLGSHGGVAGDRLEVRTANASPPSADASAAALPVRR